MFGLNSVLGVPNLWGASPPRCNHSVTFGFGAWGSSACSSMCGRRLCIIPSPQTQSLMIEAAAYSGVDSRVARTKRNEEMKRKRVYRRLGEAEDETVCEDPSISMLDDCAMEELNVGSAGCL